MGTQLLDAALTRGPGPASSGGRAYRRRRTTRPIRLYEQMGFTVEGRRDAPRRGDRYVDDLMAARLTRPATASRPEAPPPEPAV